MFGAFSNDKPINAQFIPACFFEHIWKGGGDWNGRYALFKAYLWIYICRPRTRYENMQQTVYAIGKYAIHYRHMLYKNPRLYKETA
jgi:hypothetical protein